MDIILDYLKDRYNEEIARFEHLEDKCSKFFTSVNLIIAAVTALAGFNKGKIFHDESAIGILTLVLFGLGAFCITCAWVHAFKSLQIADSTVMPRTRETAQYLLSKVEDDSHVNQYLYECYVDTLDLLGLELRTEADRLQRAYTCILASGFCLFLAVALLLLSEIAK
jgi:hypothetical protein